MANGKLSQQITQTSQQGLSYSRQSRTQRLRSQRKAQKFEQLRSRAIQTQKEKFQNVKTVEEYETEYEGLDPEIQGFFASPNEIRSERNLRIENTKERLNARQQEADERIQQAENEYQRDLAYSRNRDWRNSSEKRDYERRIKDTRDEEVAYWKGFRRGVVEGKDQLSKGKDLSFGDVIGYANDVANDQKREEKNRNTQQGARRQEERRIQDAIQEVEVKGGRFERVTASKNGKEISQQIYAVVGKKRTLISETSPKNQPNSTLKESELGRGNVTQSYRVGNKNLTFQGVEKLYVDTETGELKTAYGSLRTQEADVLNAQKRALEVADDERRNKATQYLQKENFEEEAFNKDVEKRTFLGKVFDYAKAVYVSSPFGTSVRLPDDYLEKRTKVNINKISLIGGVPSAQLYQLDLKSSLEGVKAQRNKEKEANVQSQLITRLDTLTNQAPEDIQYDVQQRGLSILRERGLKIDYDNSGNVNFSSPALTPSKSYNVYELEQAREKPSKFKVTFSEVEKARTESLPLPFQSRGTSSFNPSSKTYEKQISQIDIPERRNSYIESPYTLAVKGRIAATKATEFYLVGKGIGSVISGATKLTRGAYTSLGGGFRVTDATVRGSRVYADIVKTPKISQTALGVVVKPTVYSKVAKSALTVGVSGLYVAGKVKQRQSYQDLYGETGKEVFKYETIGEVIGIGALVTEGIVKQSQARKLNERIARENYLRQERAEYLRNVQSYGQYSENAKVAYVGGGTGRKLTDREIQELARVYSSAAGVSKKQAGTIVRESALYRQAFQVKSRLGLKTYLSNKYSLVTYKSVGTRSKELAFEFSRIRGGKPVNLAVKLTSGKGKYAFTSVYQKARYSKNALDSNYRLKQTIVSKIVKGASQPSGKLTLKRFDVESRVLRNFPSSTPRTLDSDLSRFAFPRYTEKELAKLYLRAGTGAKISPKPIKNLRIEDPRGSTLLIKGKPVKVFREGEYQFTQLGGGGREASLKRLLSEAQIKNAQKTYTRILQGSPTKTPLSKTFAKEAFEEDVRMISLKKALKMANKGSSVTETVTTRSSSGQAKSLVQKAQSVYAGTGLYERTSEVALSQFGVKDIQISPSLISNLNIRTNTRLLGGFVTSTSPAVKVAVLQAISAGLNLRSRQELKSQIKARQLPRIAEVAREAEDTTQTPRSPTRTRTSTIQTVQVPNINIREITPSIITTRTPRISTRIPAIDLPKSDFLERRRRSRKKEKGVEQAFLVPDFASRILGLSPQRVSSTKEALREINSIKTGLELRRGLIIR